MLEVARHGARAPSVIYDLAEDPSKNFQVPMELTELGANQHYKLGRDYVAQEYFSNKNLKSMENIYAQSTRKNRTLQSATSQLQGIFGTDLTYP